MKVLTYEQEQARKFLAEIEQKLEYVEDRRLAVRRCFKWLNDSGGKNLTANFAMQAACEYLVDKEKERNSIVDEYNSLRAKILSHGWSVDDLPLMEKTRYCDLPVDDL